MITLLIALCGCVVLAASEPGTCSDAQAAKMSLEQTFIMIKPDGVARGLVGEVIKRFEQKVGPLLVQEAHLSARCRPSAALLCLSVAGFRSRGNSVAQTHSCRATVVTPMLLIVDRLRHRATTCGR